MQRRILLLAFGLLALFRGQSAFGASTIRHTESEAKETELATYEYENLFAKRTFPYVMERDHDEITSKIDGEIVHSMTQTKDGCLTVIKPPHSITITHIIFDEKVFELPDGARTQGEILEIIPRTNSVVNREETFVEVEKVGNLTRYIYVTMRKKHRDVSVKVYRPDSRLPVLIQFERIEADKEKTLEQVVLTRTN